MNTKQLILATAATAGMSLLTVSAALAQDAAQVAQDQADASLGPQPNAPVSADWAEKKVVTTCQWCHGPQGHSVSPIYPALAGQKAWYIIEQLHAFRARTRADPYARAMMWGMASQLTDNQIVALADYFSKQTPFYSEPAPAFDMPKAAAICGREEHLQRRRSGQRCSAMLGLPSGRCRGVGSIPASRRSACLVPDQAADCVA